MIYKSNMMMVSTLSEHYSLKSLVFGLLGLVVACMFLIGGCNNSGPNANPDALRIGSLNGIIVPAVEEEFVLKRWREGDGENNIFLDGSTVSELTQAEQDALNNSYQAGFFIALIDPVLEDIEGLHDILGLQQLITDNNPNDLFAVSREFNVSGVRYFRINTVENEGEDSLSFERERVELLIEWANDGSPVSLAARGTTSDDLMTIADSTAITNIFSILAGGPAPNNEKQDFEGHFQSRVTVWSAYSVMNDSNFYFIENDYQFRPNTTNPREPDNPAFWPCCDCPGVDTPNFDFRGAEQYLVRNFDIPPEPTVLQFDDTPASTVCVTTVESSVSRMIGGDVSYSQEDGGGVGVSASITYENSKSITCPAVMITNLSGEGPGGNTSDWDFVTFNINLGRSTFTPTTQWIWEEDRKEGQTLFSFQTSIEVFFYQVSCFPGASPFPLKGTYTLNVSVPPTPPPPTPAPTTN